MNSSYPPPEHAETFERRRARATERLGDGVLVLPSAARQYASADTERRYAPDRELFYLTGLTSEDCWAVLVGGASPRLVIFAPDRDPASELWSGPRIDPEELADRVGADVWHSTSEIRQVLPTLLDEGDRIFFRPGRGGFGDSCVLEALARTRRRGARTGSGPRGVLDPGLILDDLRLVKDAHEIARIRAAVDVTLEGHRAGMASVRGGAGEWVVQAAVEGAFRAAGASGPGFPTIVGGGANACVLHYSENGAVLAEGALVLVDAGAELDLYHGDVTRTYPVSGRFSGRQRALYEVVAAALAAATTSVEPGSPIAGVHDAATRVLVDGLLELGLLSGSADSLIEEGAHKEFFPHQTSHWLGLDVHDPGDYAVAGSPRLLEAGMVLTVEPGLYVRPDHEAADWAGLGIRLEDDVLVTESGHEVLSGALPVEPDDVEILIRDLGGADS